MDDCLHHIDQNFMILKNQKILNVGNFTFESVSNDYIKQLIDYLDDGSSPGCVGIPTKILKSSTKMVNYFTKLINQCILKGEIPEDWLWSLHFTKIKVWI